MRFPAIFPHFLASHKTIDSANDGGLHRKIVFITLEIFLLMRQPVVFQLFLSFMSGCYILLFFIYIYIYMYIYE